MKKGYKLSLYLSLLLLSIISIGMVSANEINDINTIVDSNCDSNVDSVSSLDATVNSLNEEPTKINAEYANNNLKEDNNLEKDTISTYDTAEPGTFTDLNNLITDDTTNTISLSQNYSYDSNIDSGLTDGITIDKDLVINGEGYTIDGAGSARIFQITNGAVTINNLNLINGKYGDSGGAIWTFRTVNINGSTFINNSAEYGGGAIWTLSDVNINGSIFINNSAEYGGAIYAGTVNVTNSTFINNSAEYGGGAIVTSGNVNINGSIFINNSAEYGGAIYAYDGVYVINSIFVGNTATSNGKAICYLGSFVGDSNFWGVNFENEEEFKASNTITNYVGGIYKNVAPDTWVLMNISGSDLFNGVTGYEVTLNKLNTGGDVAGVLPDFTVDFSAANGGVISPSEVTIHEGVGKFTYAPGNANTDVITASYDGKEIISKNIYLDGSFTALQTIIANAQAGSTLTLNKNYTYSATGDSLYVGGITIDKDLVINGEGYTIDGAGSARIFRITNGAVTINNLNLINGKAADVGGAIYSTGSGLLTFNNINFSNNTAKYGGAVLAVNVDVIDSTFTNNNASEGDGGAISANNMNFTTYIFINNSAKKNGGAISAVTVNVTNSIFINNSANENGGAISANYVDVTGSNFINNTSISGGGAINTWNNVNVANSNFIGNSATNGKAIIYFDSFVGDSNFWGVNFENKEEFKNSGTIVEYDKEYDKGHVVSPDTWVLMNISGSDLFNGVTGYEVTLNKLNTGGDVAGVLPDFTVDLSAANGGVISPSEVTIPEGVGKFTYTPGNANTDVITASYDGKEIVSKEIDKEFYRTSVANDYLVTVVNGSVVVSVISPNGTVDSGRVDLRKGGTLISTSELANGKATLNIKGLKSGNYSVIIYYLGNDVYSGSSKWLNLEILFNNTIATTLSGSDYNESYGVNKSFSVLLTDENGNGLANQSINFQLINSIGETMNYTVITNGSGVASLAIDLNVGVYDIVYSFNSVGDYIQSNGTSTIIITLNNAKINSDLYNGTSGSNFTTTLTDEFGNPIVGAEVKFKLYNQLGEYKVYWRTTNTGGVAKLPINLIPGTWTIETSYFNSNYNVNSINQTVIVQVVNVSAVLSPDIYNETYGVNKNFTVKFQKTDGESIVGKELKLTLYNQFGDSKVYWRTTNVDGVAKLSITLISGIWIVESAYIGNDYPTVPINQTIVINP